MMHCVTLLGGSNHPLKEAILEHARAVVERRVGRVVRSSSVHYSEPWGFEADEPFANVAWVVESELEPEAVLCEVLAAEQEVGRDREAEEREKALTGQRYASRVVDIDVIFYDDIEWHSPTLTLPHPRVWEREFALIPLKEVGIQNSKFTAAIKRGQSQTRLSYAEREQTREDL